MCDVKVESNSDIDFCVERLRELRMISASIKKEEEELRAKICEYMGEADELYNDRGFMLVSYKQAMPTYRIDQKALRDAMPDVYEKFLVETKSSRRFLIK